MSTDFLAWLRGWLGRHPLKTPPAESASYTAEVMTRVRVLSRPAPAFRWLVQPRWVLAVGSVAAACAVLVTVGRPPQRLAESVGELDDEAWLEETLTLLHETGEDVEMPVEGDAADQWLLELEALDDESQASS